MSKIKITIIHIFILLLSAGCASSNISGFVLEKPEVTYKRIMVTPIEDSQKFKILDDESYKLNVKSSLNNLNSFKYRDHLQKSMVRNLQSAYTNVLRSNDYFQIHNDVEFDHFERVLDSLLVEAILFVDVAKYWETNYITNDGVRTEDNGIFNCFLMDRRTNKLVWIGNFRIDGQLYTGYDVINNTLSRAVYRKLVKGGYIHI